MEQVSKQRDDRLSLKVKIKSLAEEARIIRKEESKAPNDPANGVYDQQNLWNHRINVVRPEARATLLAYGYIRGRTYREVEPNSTTAHLIPWKKVRYMVERYGPQPFDLEALDLWAKGAREGNPFPHEAVKTFHERGNGSAQLGE